VDLFAVAQELPRPVVQREPIEPVRHSQSTSPDARVGGRVPADAGL
jgi:hypothetical protein